VRPQRGHLSGLPLAAGNDARLRAQDGPVYAKNAIALEAAARELAKAVKAAWPENAKDLLGKEARRAEFEAQELRVMAHQQTAMNWLGQYHNSGDTGALEKAKAELRATIAAFARAKELAGAAGIGEKSWYQGNINGWITKELQAKLERYS